MCLFRLNVTLIFFSYGVTQLSGEFVIAKWYVNDTEYNNTITVDSGSIPKIMFHTPLDMSFTCKDIGDFSIDTKMRIKPSFPSPFSLHKTNVTTSDLKFDAFRDPKHPTPTGFRVRSNF